MASKKAARKRAVRGAPKKASKGKTAAAAKKRAAIPKKKTAAAKKRGATAKKKPVGRRPPARGKKTAARAKKTAAPGKKTAVRGKKAAVRGKKIAVRGKRPRRQPARKPGPPPVVSVGDSVLIQAGESGRPEASGARPAGLESALQGMEGLVCAIREIATGRLVGKTAGPLEGYVLEVLHQRTFRPEFSSNRNTGGARGPTPVAGGPAWAKVRELLRDMSRRSQFISQASGQLSGEPFDSLLDGWRVVKVRAQMVELGE